MLLNIEKMDQSKDAPPDDATALVLDLSIPDKHQLSPPSTMEDYSDPSVSPDHRLSPSSTTKLHFRHPPSSSAFIKQEIPPYRKKESINSPFSSMVSPKLELVPPPIVEPSLDCTSPSTAFFLPLHNPLHACSCVPDQHHQLHASFTPPQHNSTCTTVPGKLHPLYPCPYSSLSTFRPAVPGQLLQRHTNASPPQPHTSTNRPLPDLLNQLQIKTSPSIVVNPELASTSSPRSKKNTSRDFKQCIRDPEEIANLQIPASNNVDEERNLKLHKLCKNILGKRRARSNPNKKKPVSPIEPTSSDQADDGKPPGYWEMRRKNNKSAKISRERRRQREEDLAIRVYKLEEEKIELIYEIKNTKKSMDEVWKWHSAEIAHIRQENAQLKEENSQLKKIVIGNYTVPK